MEGKKKKRKKKRDPPKGCGGFKSEMWAGEGFVGQGQRLLLCGDGARGRPGPGAGSAGCPVPTARPASSWGAAAAAAFTASSIDSLALRNAA